MTEIPKEILNESKDTTYERKYLVMRFNNPRMMEEYLNQKADQLQIITITEVTDATHPMGRYTLVARKL